MIVLFTDLILRIPLSYKFLITLWEREPAPIINMFWFSGASKIFLINVKASPLTDKELIPILVFVLAFLAISITLSAK